MNGVIYARYSSDNQREESIEGQLRECKEFANRNDITIVDTYIDRAFSAKTDNRPSFQKMIRDSAKNQFDVIIVWKLDRFARNRYDSAHYKAQLRKNGVKVVSATETISEGAEGIILESVLEGMAEYYSAELAEKVIRGQTENAMKCKFNGGPVTFGYYIDDEQHFQIDEETAPYIIQIYNAYDSGMTMKEIAEDLNNKGVSNSRGGRFTINIISKILSNRRYIGEYRFRDIVVPDGIPTIVDKDLFDRVQASLEKNKHASAKYKADDEYILTTKLYCGNCKSFMVGESGTNHQGLTYRYYKCIDAKRGRGCKKKAVKKDYIESAVLNAVVAALTNEDYINQLIEALLEYQELENTDLKFLQQQLLKTNKKIDNMLNAIEQGIITDSTKQRLQELESKKKDIKVQIAQEEISKPKYTREQYQQFFNNAKVADLKDQAQRKALINYFVNAVVLYDDYALFYLNYKEHALKLKLSDIEKSSDTLLNALPAGGDINNVTAFSMQNSLKLSKIASICS